MKMLSTPQSIRVAALATLLSLAAPGHAADSKAQPSNPACRQETKRVVVLPYTRRSGVARVETRTRNVCEAENATSGEQHSQQPRRSGRYGPRQVP